MEKLYNFSRLKNRLKQCGYNVDERSRYRVIKEDLKDALYSGKIKILNNEFVYEDEGRQKHVYFYLHDYNSSSLSNLPKFHTTACNTITRFINQGDFNQRYVVSNSSMCSVKNINTGEYKPSVKLEICANCQKQMPFKKNHIHTTIDFFNENVEQVDRNGYPIEWKSIRNNYINKHSFKCERCGVDLREHRNMLEVYHKDKNKFNNKGNNLLLLCTDCACKYDKALEERLRKNLILQEKIKQIKGIRKNQGIKK